MVFFTFKYKAILKLRGFDFINYIYIQTQTNLAGIKNWLTFLNFNLFNQNIVNSQAAMTVNYDKASPSAHM